MLIDTATIYQPSALRAGWNQLTAKALATGLLTSAMMLYHPSACAETNRTWPLNNPLVSFSATYSVGNNFIVAGEAVVELKHAESGGEWRYSLKTKPKGVFKIAGRGHLREVSIFEVVNGIDGDIIQPKLYQLRQDNQQKRSIDGSFNWDQHVLYFRHGSDTDTTEITSGTLDRMTMTLTMMSNLTDDFEDTIVDVFDGGRIKQLQLVSQGSETITTAIGKLDTVVVRSSTVGGSSRETITWFAPKLNNVPVKIEQRKHGELVARLSIKRYEADE